MLTLICALASFQAELVPGYKWLVITINIGAIAGLTSVILVSLMSQPRIFYSMAVDGFMPPWAAKVNSAELNLHLSAHILATPYSSPPRSLACSVQESMLTTSCHFYVGVSPRGMSDPPALQDAARDDDPVGRAVRHLRGSAAHPGAE